MPLTTFKLPGEDIITGIYLMFGALFILGIVLIVFFLKWLTKTKGKRK